MSKKESSLEDRIKVKAISEVVFCPNCRGTNVGFDHFNDRINEDSPIWKCHLCKQEFEPQPTTAVPVDHVLAVVNADRAEHNKQLTTLLKTCPLLPNLTLMRIGTRSKLLGEHSVKLDEWYQDLKRLVHKLGGSC